MTAENLDFALGVVLRYVPEGETRERMKQILRDADKDGDEVVRLLKSRSDERKHGGIGGSVKFTGKEIETMPDYLKRVIAYDDKVIPYRYYNGVYQARYRRDGYDIEVASKDFNVMKDKLIQRFKDAEAERAEKDEKAKVPLFGDYAKSWLKLKEAVVKPLTLKSYTNLVNVHLIPAFGEMSLDAITREDVQAFLNGLVDEGKNRTAEQATRVLGPIFDLAAEDFGIKSPMGRIVLPHFEVKKGSALSKAEERQLVDFCVAHPEYSGSDALLLLLYTGMRIGELSSASCDDKYVYCVSEKTRKGYADVTRKIPISPMLRRVMPYIDMAKAKNGKNTSVERALKQVFPERHPHELRYTFITRAKECGINPEVIMEWDGHKEDSDCRSSRVDRGYTTFSEEYYLSEICKFDYEL